MYKEMESRKNKCKLKEKTGQKTQFEDKNREKIVRTEKIKQYRENEREEHNEIQKRQQFTHLVLNYISSLQLIKTSCSRAYLKSP